MINLLLALALAGQLHDAPKPYVGTRKATVDGSVYRVTIKDSGEVVVASKAIIVKRNMQRNDQMHEAVRNVSGCRLVQELWEGAVLHGKLDCLDADRPPPANAPATAEAAKP